MSEPIEDATHAERTEPGELSLRGREYLTSGTSDDESGIWASYLLGRAQPCPWAQFLATTPTVVATFDAVIATVGAGALALNLGASRVALVVLCPRGLPLLLGRSLCAPDEGIQYSAPERGALSVEGRVKGVAGATGGGARTPRASEREQSSSVVPRLEGYDRMLRTAMIRSTGRRDVSPSVAMQEHSLRQGHYGVSSDPERDPAERRRVAIDVGRFSFPGSCQLQRVPASRRCILYRRVRKGSPKTQKA